MKKIEIQAGLGSLGLVGLLAVSACGTEGPPKRALPTGRLVFKDDFNREQLGDNWRQAGSAYRIEKNELLAQGAKNHPLWLKAKLPRDARIEFSARSMSTAVDIKAELFGDGRSKPVAASYKATSYVLVLGGWNNKLSIIARMDEHGADRVVRRSPKGIPKKQYQFTAVRQGKRLSWYVDGAPFLELEDPNPLADAGHEHFAFNNWRSKVFFDDLCIYEL